MNLATLHYHFNRGGVTQVVLNQLRALQTCATDSSDLRCAVIHGGRTEGLAGLSVDDFLPVDVSLEEVPTLEYDSGIEVRSGALADEIETTLRRRSFAPESTVLHIHNHCLGKNVSMPGAVSRLAERGYRILLQIHDFAEDFRPENYSRMDAAGITGGLYPQASQIHYATINGRDLNILRRVGVAENNLHLLPNSIGALGELPAKQEVRNKLRERFGVPPDVTYAVYPVRGIRRKNLGEALLWSVLGGKNFWVGFTLPPMNPVEQPNYARWKQFVEELSLDCVFETGGEDGLPFKENLSAADLFLTTSVAEGFGMVFLESWLAARRLIGRDLPDITAGFVEAGMKLDGLNSLLVVPTQWVGRQALRDSLSKSLRDLLKSYGLASTQLDEFMPVIDSIAGREQVDFAHLDWRLQEQVIRDVHADEARRQELLRDNAWIQDALRPSSADEQIINHNASVIEERFSLEGTGQRLLQLYRQILDGPADCIVTPADDTKAVLDAFLDPHYLYPIRFVP